MTEKKLQLGLIRPKVLLAAKTLHFGRVSPPLELPYPFSGKVSRPRPSAAAQMILSQVRR